MLDYEIANDLIDEMKEEPAIVKKTSHIEERALVEAPLQVEEPVLIEDLRDEIVHISPNIHDPDISLQAFFQSNTIEVNTTECTLQEESEIEGVTLAQTEADQHERIFETVPLLVHRSTLLKDLINAFSDPKILISSLFVKVVDNNGNEEEGEGRGVLRDVLTEFWVLFLQSLAIGALSKVPVIRHDYQQPEWKAIGRILLYGYCREGIFPLALSPTFISICIFGEDSVSEEMLLDSFGMYISADEKETMDSCLANQENISGNSDLMELLSSYSCHRIPNAENILSIFCQLAHQELIQRPRYVANCWSPILQSFKACDCFQSAANRVLLITARDCPRLPGDCPGTARGLPETARELPGSSRLPGNCPGTRNCPGT